MHNRANITPSVIAITTGGIIKAKNIPATKPIIHKPPDFFI